GGAQRRHPDGTLVLKDGKSEWYDCSPLLWDVGTGRMIRRLDNAEDFVRGVAFSPDGRQAAATANTRLLVFDLDAPGNPRPRVIDRKSVSMSGVVFSPDGRLLIDLAGWGEMLSVRDAATGRKLAAWSLGNATATRLAIASDSRHVAVGMNTGVIYLLRLPEFESRR